MGVKGLAWKLLQDIASQLCVKEVPIASNTIKVDLNNISAKAQDPEVSVHLAWLRGRWGWGVKEEFYQMIF